MLKKIYWFTKMKFQSAESVFVEEEKSVFVEEENSKIANFEFRNRAGDSIGKVSTNITEKHSAHRCTSICDSKDPVAFSVIVPTIGRSIYIPEVLEAAANSLQSSAVTFEILLSIDGSVSEKELGLIIPLLKNLPCKSIRIIDNRKSLISGFAAQVNCSVEKAVGTNLIILNDDAVMSRNVVDEFLSLAPSNNRYIFSPYILDGDGKIQEIGSQISKRGDVEWIGTGHSPVWISKLNVLEVPFISAVCWIMRKELFIECGGFKEFGHVPYYEDSKFALNPKNCIKTYVSMKTTVTHYLSQSIDPVQKNIKVENLSKPLFKDWWIQHHANDNKKVKVIAFYLPQFHPTDYNNFWWGTGYTEWTALSRWQRLIHEQPPQVVPSELGFYDLSAVSVIEKQSKLAAKYGIDAFAVMTYWFNGKRFLTEPLQNFLTANLSNNFFLYWANESWTRRWDGKESEVLEKQTHSVEDSRKFINFHSSYFLHPNYQVINGGKLIFIYRRELFENVIEHVQAMREEARALGIGELFICVLESFDQSHRREDPRKEGFDAAVEYPPHGSFPISDHSVLDNVTYSGRVHDYRELMVHYGDRPIEKYPLIRGVTTGFDNTARLGSRATIFRNANLMNFSTWIRSAMKNTLHFGDETDNFIIINGWNEWSESAVLEPSTQYGRDYLFQVKAAKDYFNGEILDVRHE